MRGTDQQQNHIFSYLSLEERVRKDHPLRAVEARVDEVLQQLSRRFDAMYVREGRPSIPPEQLFWAQSLPTRLTPAEDKNVAIKVANLVLSSPPPPLLPPWEAQTPHPSHRRTSPQ